MKRLLPLALAAFLAASASAQTAAPEKAPAKAAPAAKSAATTSAATIQDKAIQQIDAFIRTAKINKAAPGWKTSLPKPPQLTFDPAHKYYVHMVTTKGPMLIKLMPDVAPMHVSSWIYLARLGFYDGLKFHRAIKGFMIQGGDPLGNGRGNPGYAMNGEFSKTVLHDQAGRVSTANAGPGTDGSQFFITFGPTKSLDGGYTIVGQVTSGMDVLKKLEAVSNTGDGPPVEPVGIVKATVEVK